MILILLLLIFMMKTIFLEGSVNFFLQVIIRFEPLWHTVVCLACLKLYTMQCQLSQCQCSVTTIAIQPRQSMMVMHWRWNSRNLPQRSLCGLSMKSFMIKGEKINVKLFYITCYQINFTQPWFFSSEWGQVADILLLQSFATPKLRHNASPHVTSYPTKYMAAHP